MIRVPHNTDIPYCKPMLTTLLLLALGSLPLLAVWSAAWVPDDDGETPLVPIAHSAPLTAYAIVACVAGGWSVALMGMSPRVMLAAVVPSYFLVAVAVVATSRPGDWRERYAFDPTRCAPGPMKEELAAPPEHLV